MSSSVDILQPTFSQRVKYVTGRTVPDELLPWVTEDVAGPGASRRFAARCIVPLLPILVALLLIPGPAIIRISMVLLLFFPFVYFLLALKTVYLRHRLVSHGLSPALLVARKQQQIDADKHLYELNYRS